ncbi:DDB1- and CUL4-associated factor 8 isoform X2, partial [Olea europaea subsp. europaea]
MMLLYIPQIDLKTSIATELFTCQSGQHENYISAVLLNAIAIDPRNPNFFAVGRSDEFAQLFDIRKYKCEYVVSGSGCGRIFIWKKGGKLIRVMEADKHVVNCIEPHPHTMMLASSGIENDNKIWIPKAVDRATQPTNIELIRDGYNPALWMLEISTPVVEGQLGVNFADIFARSADW